MLLSVVIPVYNEEKTVVELINRVLREKTPKEIIVVDDGSTDSTLSEIQNSKFEIRNNKKIKIKILQNESNLGKGAAVRKGISNATGDILIIQDADLEYSPSDYSKLLKPIIEKKTEVVYGTRLKTLKFKLFGKEKTPLPLHYITNRLLSVFTNILYSSNLTDMETCYKVMTKKVYRKLNLVSNRFEIEPEITAKILINDQKIIEVPIKTNPRSYKQGKKIKARDAFRAIFTLLKYSSLKVIFQKYWLLFTILFSIFLFRKSFTTYFSQDDFFRFRMSQANNLYDVLNFFSFKNQFLYGFYRPISINVYSLLCQKLFGLNYFFYHLLNYSIFIISVYLVFKIMAEICNDKYIPVISAFIYGVSSVHLTTLSYLPSVEEILVGVFFFLTIYLYLKGSKLSLITFVLSLLSRETAVTLPIIILLIEIFNKRKWFKIIPYLIILLLYFYLRLGNNFIPDKNVYQLSFSPKNILNNYFWFSLWGIGAPENLVDFVNGLKLNITFFNFNPILTITLIISLIIFVLLLIVTGIYTYIKEKKYRSNIILFLLWTLITLLPFVFLIFHKFAFYLYIPLFGISGIIAIIISENKKIGLLVLLLFLWQTLLTTTYYNGTFWGINRPKISQKILKNLLEKYPTLPKEATIYFLNDEKYQIPSKDWGGTSTQARIALSDCNGPKFIYKDNSLKCLFEDDKPVIKNDLYTIVVKIN